ncbi:MAG: N-acetylmuramoyl-L-alanine amidase [Bacillota bacterium]
MVVLKETGKFELTRFTIKKIAFIILLLAAVIAGASVINDAASVFGVQGSLKGMLIALDAGHGGFDGGAVGASGVSEDEINLAVVKKLREELIARGAGVVLTRENEDALAGTKSEDMAMRRDVVKESGADILVSIHMNKFFDTNVCGPQVFYMSGSEGGKALAEGIQGYLNEAAPQSKKRCALTGDYFMLRTVDATAVIIECGFLSNAAEENLLKSDGYQQKLATAIANGIADYVSRYSEQKIPPNGSQE